MNLRASIANTLWLSTCLEAYDAFKSALADPGRAQLRILRQSIARNADTAFGREHHFDRIHDPASFQSHVPVRDYDDLSPWLARILAGEPRVLTADPVTRLVPSSGTTAAAKLVPYTAGLQRQLNAAIGPWITDLFARDRTLMGGPAYWSVTPVAPPRIRQPSAVPIGYADDAEYLGGFRRRLVQAVMAVPADVKLIGDIEPFRRTVAQHLLACRELRLISVWHPSFLELLLDTAESLAGHADWQRIWPHLKLVSCWADAHAAGPAQVLQRRLPFVTLQPKGLLATEAFVSIPFAGHWPLAVCSHFFEFERDGRVYLADELEPGGEYGVIVTTAGGLWRVRLGDTVRCEGFLHKTPSVRFVGRRDLVVDRFGEKLSEGFVGETIRTWLTTMNATARFAMLTPTGDHYTLLIETDTTLPMVSQLDAALSANPHYAYCRSLGQLGEVVIARVHHAYQAYTARRQQEGVRMGDIKPVALDAGEDWDETFAGLLVD